MVKTDRLLCPETREGPNGPRFCGNYYTTPGQGGCRSGQGVGSVPRRAERLNC